MSKFVIVLINGNGMSVNGPYSSQGKALDSVNELAAKQKPKLAKGQKYETDLQIDCGNFRLECVVNDATEGREGVANLTILPLVK